MLFNSFVFFIFLAVVLPIFHLLPSKKSKNLFLLASSYFFYGYWDWRFCSLLAFSTVVDFLIGQRLFQTDCANSRKRLLMLSVIVNIGLLSFFKYCNFFVESFAATASTFGLELDYIHLNIILPVGISFYTFQTMSYTIDIYRNKMKPTENFIDFALFVAFFPQLVAGPIERARHLLPQLSQKLKPSREQFEQGVALIVFGLFRKVLIGDTAGRIVDNIFIQPDRYMSIELICALILFSIQIYADFSGYSSIARGVGRLLGVELVRNFEQPYLAKNISEFWQRWHISLFSWIRDYVYISMGGDRLGLEKTFLNVLVVFLLCGLWHGAGYNFIIWGVLHGIMVALHKVMVLDRDQQGDGKIIKRFDPLWKTGLKVFVTYSVVTLLWLFFRAQDLSVVSVFFQKMIYWQTSDLAFRFILITLTFFVVTLVLDTFEVVTGKHSYVLLLPEKSMAYGIMMALFVVTLAFMFQSEPMPFIYFQF